MNAPLVVPTNKRKSPFLTCACCTLCKIVVLGGFGSALGSGGNDCTRLNGFQSGLNFTRALITLHRFLGQAALDNGPEAGRHWRAERVRKFAHDGRADLKAGASFKRQASGSRFIEHNSKRPQDRCDSRPRRHAEFRAPCTAKCRLRWMRPAWWRRSGSCPRRCRASHLFG